MKRKPHYRKGHEPISMTVWGTAKVGLAKRERLSRSVAAQEVKVARARQNVGMFAGAKGGFRRAKRPVPSQLATALSRAQAEHRQAKGRMRSLLAQAAEHKRVRITVTGVPRGRCQECAAYIKEHPPAGYGVSVPWKKLKERRAYARADGEFDYYDVSGATE